MPPGDCWTSTSEKGSRLKNPRGAGTSCTAPASASTSSWPGSIPAGRSWPTVPTIPTGTARRSSRRMFPICGKRLTPPGLPPGSHGSSSSATAWAAWSAAPTWKAAAIAGDVAMLVTLGTPHVGIPVDVLYEWVSFITLGTVTLDDYCQAQPAVCQFADDESDPDYPAGYTRHRDLQRPVQQPGARRPLPFSGRRRRLL